MCLPNDQCADAIAIGEVCQLSYTTIGASTDGPPHSPACEDGTTGYQVNNDTWYDYTASCSGDVTVSLCGSTFNTKLAVYDGCTCDLGDANLIGCDDNTCGLQSSITFPATEGSCYKIRIGGFTTQAGIGGLTITNTGVPCTSSCASDLNGDGVTNVIDLLNLIGNWGPCPPCPFVCASDLNHDGVTNVTDLLQLIGSWGACS
ncbi:MAG: hypothetical protein L0Y44_14460 [Phycisphaerales bacterium]|nr:hypothetical protein [Phycisphaerales bacterium]MCI0631846.1 hypothetical protein [Phycisphaerales bacterium]MCI0676652.1 hypothetical protein [Phycisphaerales bacterium]